MTSRFGGARPDPAGVDAAEPPTVGRGDPTAGDRSPWDPARCRPESAGRWALEWVVRTGSTNDDLAARGSQGAADRTVLVADVQTAGRGRLGRHWQAPAGAALTFSVLLRPDEVAPARWSWGGALLGLAVCAGIRHRTGLSAGLKWPNDVLIGGRKAAGILANSTGGALVLGAGINVGQRAGELPRPDATSLMLEGAGPDAAGRERLLAAVLDSLARLLDRWCAARGDVDRAGLRAEYLRCCVTVGRPVTIQLPGAPPVTGTAVDVAADGSIVVDDGRTVRSFCAGDVVHLRGGPPVLSDP